MDGIDFTQVNPMSAEQVFNFFQEVTNEGLINVCGYTSPRQHRRTLSETAKDFKRHLGSLTRA